MTEQVNIISSDKLLWAQSFLEQTRQDLQDAGKSFFKVCFRLYEAKNCNYPIALGYSDIYELAESEFGFKRSTTASYIAICHRFMYGQMFVAEGWKDYSFSQLVEMLPIKYINKAALPPTCTVKQIREWKQAQKALNNSDNVSVQTSGQKTAVVNLQDFEKDLSAISNVSVVKSPRLNLKNKSERENFLSEYKSWGVWLSVPELDLTCYKYKFANGDELVVSESYYYFGDCYRADKKVMSTRYHLRDTGKRNFFDLSGIAKTYVLDYMTKNAAAI